MQNGDLIDGVTFVAIERRHDQRGQIAICSFDTIPFTLARTFAISGVPEGASRAGHALSCDELLWTATGSCRLALSNGTQELSFNLEEGGQGVLVSAGVWIKLDTFAPGTVILGFAPAPYAETLKFDVPRPDLIAGRPQR